MLKLMNVYLTVGLFFLSLGPAVEAREAKKSARFTFQGYHIGEAMPRTTVPSAECFATAPNEYTCQDSHYTFGDAVVKLRYVVWKGKFAEFRIEFQLDDYGSVKKMLVDQMGREPKDQGFPAVGRGWPAVSSWDTADGTLNVNLQDNPQAWILLGDYFGALLKRIK